MNFTRTLCTSLLLMLAVAIALPAQSRVRLVNVITDAPSLDLHIDSAATASASAVAVASASEQVGVTTATHRLTVTAAGAPLSTAVLDTSVAMGKDSAYTLILTGGEVIDPIIIANRDTTAIPGDSVLIRFLQLVPSAGNVGIAASLGGGSAFTVEDLGYRAITSYRMVPASDLTLTLKGEGGKAIHKSLGYLTGGTAVTVILTGAYDPANLDRLHIYGLVDSYSGAQVPMASFSLVPLAQGAFRAVHALAGKGPIAIFSDNTQSDSLPLAYRYASAVRTDLLGAHRFAVATQRAGFASPFMTADVNIAADSLATLIVAGSDGPISSPVVIYSAASDAPPSGMVLFRVVNAIGSNTPIDVLTTFSDSSKEGAVGLAFTASTPFSTVPAGALTIALTSNSERRAYVGALPENTVVTAILAGGTNGEPETVSLLVEDNPLEQEPMVLLSQESSVPLARAASPIAPASILPNPASADAQVLYTLPARGEVTISLHDLLGREVMQTAVGFQEAGAHTTRFSVASLPSGTYAVVIRDGAGKSVAVGKVVVAR